MIELIYKIRNLKISLFLVVLILIVNSCAYTDQIKEKSINTEILDTAKKILYQKNLIKRAILPKQAVRVNEFEGFKLAKDFELDDWVVFSILKTSAIDLTEGYLIVIDSATNDVVYHSYCFQSRWTWEWNCEQENENGTDPKKGQTNKK